MKYKIKGRDGSFIQEIIEGDFVSTENGCLEIQKIGAMGVGKALKVFAGGVWSTCETIEDDKQ